MVSLLATSSPPQGGEGGGRRNRAPKTQGTWVCNYGTLAVEECDTVRGGVRHTYVKQPELTAQNYKQLKECVSEIYTRPIF